MCIGSNQNKRACEEMAGHRSERLETWIKKKVFWRDFYCFFGRLCSHWFPYTFENIIGQENNENLAVEGLKLPIFVSSHDLSPSVTEFQLKFWLDPRNVFICQFVKNKMSSKINQNISACLGSIFEDTKSNVVKYEVELSE